MKIRILIFFVLSVSIVFPAFAQKNQSARQSKGYQIEVKLRETPPDTLFYLVSYYGDRKVKVDSTVSNSSSRNLFVFRADTVLPSGVYIVVNQRHIQLFELIIDKSQRFSIEADTLNTVKTISAKNSPETQLFYEYLKGFTARQDSVRQVERILDSAQRTGNQELFNRNYPEYVRKISRVDEFTSKFIMTHPHELFAKVLKMNQDIKMPPLPTLPDGTKDSTWGWHYFKSHYWDNTDLTDARIIRSPVFGSKITVFFDELIHQHPDSISAEIDTFLTKIRPSNAMFRYMLTWLTDRYQQSPVVGHDAVFVGLIEKYYLHGDAPWMSENMMRIYTQRAAQLKSILIGAVIPELVMPDTSGTLLSNRYTGTKFTIMWFWDPDCVHCAVETPKLLDFYHQYKDSLDISVFAVSLDKDLDRWKKYIRDHQLDWINVGGEKANIDYSLVFDITATPVIFVFDDKMRIIAKNLPVESLPGMLRRYEELSKMR